jgi:di/tricarboxylate transporter
MVGLGAVIVVLTLVAMASGKVPPVLALGTGLAVAGLSGVTPTSDLFAGLSNGGVITVAAMLVIAKGIVATGVVTRVTWRLLSSVTTAGEALRRLMVPIGVGSALMNTTPIVAMLIPATKELEQTRRVPSREVLLPIAHITTLAGSITLIGTSSNLLIAGIASTDGVEVTMLSFAPVALPVALVGWAVIYLTAPRVLGGATTTEKPPKLWRVEIPVAASANALGRHAGDLGVARTQDYRLVGIERWGEMVDPSMAIEVEDVLIFSATEDGVRALWKSPRFGLSPDRLYEVTVGTGEHGTLHDLEDDGDIVVVAAQTTKPLRETPAVAGETCFVTGADPEVLREHDHVALWQDAASRAPQPAKTNVALAILAGVILLASFGVVPVELAAFTGALLMVLARVITPTSAVRALDWNVLFILAGSVGLGNVVVSSGLANEIADAIRYLSAGSVLLVVIVFVLTTAVMTNLVTNAATASILTPVAIVIATELDLDPVMLLALIGTCISFTLINPFSHQSNLMVMGPGGYSGATFARFGVPILVVCVVTAVAVGYLLLGR